MKGPSMREFALAAASGLALILSTSGTLAAGGTAADTTTFNLQAPWTTPERDYGSRTYGVATFLSGGPSPDGISWTHHFSLPSSPVFAASLYITLKDDGDSESEHGWLSCHGYFIDVSLYHPPGGLASPRTVGCQPAPPWPLPDTGECIFRVYDGTYEFNFTPGMVNWLNSGALTCVFRAGVGSDFYIKSSVLEMHYVPPAQQPWEAYIDDVQEVYIGYYQRPADPAGLIYWAKRLDAAGGNLDEIIEAFANSAESQSLYGQIDGGNISTVVNAIYRSLFGRDAEIDGLAYYVNGFNSGRFTPATIMLNVLDGAQNADLQSVSHKVFGAELFTATIDPELDAVNLQAHYAGQGDATAARDFLSTYATSTRVPIQGETTAYIQGSIADPGDPILY